MTIAPHVQAVLSRLPSIRRTANGWEARCLAHNDREASLCVGIGDGGRVLIHCQAGCDHPAVMQALGLTDRDLFAPTNGDGKHRGNASLGEIVAEYPYHDEHGTLLFQVVRFNPKTFRQRRPDGQAGWTWRVSGVRRVLYRLPELLAADPAAWVFLCEGEKDVDRLRSLGLVATTNVAGAKKWRAEYGEFMRGRRVAILPDNDEPGRQHAEQVEASLQGIASDVRVVELPGLPEHGDVSDW